MGAETMKKTKKPFSMKKWVKSRNGQQTIVILSFMIIPLLLLFVFTYLPFGEMVKFSFYKMKYATPVDKRQFVGFRNYIDVFKKDECFSALKLSLYYMAGAMVQLVLALYLATILSFKTKFGNMFKGFMFFPYLISGIAIGFIFKFFYTRGFVFDTVLQWCGFNLESLPFWLKDKSVNNISLVASSVWRYYGNNMVLFIGAIMSVDSEMYEAAELDGCTPNQMFWKITIPLIRPILVYVMITSMIGGLQMFDVPQILTNGKGGPDRTSTTMIMYLNNHLFSKNYGMAGAVSVVLFLVCAVLCVVVYFSLTKEDDGLTKAQRKELKAAKKAAAKGGK